MGDGQCVRYFDGKAEKVALPSRTGCTWEVRPVVAEGAVGDSSTWEDCIGRLPEGERITFERANELSGFYMPREVVMEEIAFLLHRMRDN